MQAAIVAASTILCFAESENLSATKPGRRGTDRAKVAAAAACSVDSPAQEKCDALMRRVENLSGACAALMSWQQVRDGKTLKQNEGKRGKTWPQVTCWCCKQKGHRPGQAILRQNGILVATHAQK